MLSAMDARFRWKSDREKQVANYIVTSEKRNAVDLQLSKAK